MRTLLQWSLALLLGMTLTSQLLALDLKNPPLNRIYDPGRFLDEDFTTDIAYRISYERDHRQFEVFVILFEEEPPQGAGILAKQAGESWSEGEYWCVVYQVGKDSEPDCLVGGDLMAQLPAEELERTVRGARNTALLVSTPQRRLEEIVNNLSDEFGFLQVRLKEAHEKSVEKWENEQAEKIKRKEALRALAAVLIVVFLGLAFLAFVLWKKHLRKLKPMMFPHTSPRRRLAAPFSGGGDVLVKYGKRH